MRCAFCTAEAIALCTVPETDMRILMPAELRAGDSVQRPVDLQFYLVAGVARQIGYDARVHVHLIMGPNDLRLEEFRPTLPVLVKLTEPCGRPACYRHMQERGDKHFCCAEHWDVERVYSVA
jgi:hypothetical protein